MKNWTTSRKCKSNSSQINCLSHKIIFELEKRKRIDERKTYNDEREKRNEETRFVLENIENVYQDKILMLKNQIKQDRRRTYRSKTAKKKLLTQLETCLKNEKIFRATEMIDMWRVEKEKFDVLMKDDGALEKKIMNLY